MSPTAKPIRLTPDYIILCRKPQRDYAFFPGFLIPSGPVLRLVLVFILFRTEILQALLVVALQ